MLTSALCLVLGLALNSNGIDANESSEKKLLHGRHFVVGTLKLPPYASYDSGPNDTIENVDGFVPHIVSYLSEKHQFTFHYVRSEGGAFGGYVNGSWNGLVGMLERRRIDLAATGLSVNYQRSQVMDFCYPYMEDPVSLMIPYPELDTNAIHGVTKPFQYEVWIGLLISMIACGAILWFFSFSQSRWHKTPTVSFGENTWFLFSVLVNANRMYESGGTARILVACWCLIAVVLVNAYQTTLTTYLMAPRYIPMVDSVEDIVAQPRPIFMVKKFTNFEIDIMNAKSGPLTIVADSLRKHPELYVLTSDDAAGLVVKYKRSYTEEKSVLLALMENDLKASGRCRLYLAKRPWDTSLTSFGLPKHSPIITHIFNKDIIWLRQVGLLEHWRRAFWPRPNRCSAPLATRITSNKKLSLNYLSSAFLLFGAGMLISLVVFMLELLVGCGIHSRK